MSSLVTKVRQKQLIQALETGKRLDGRALTEYRPLKIEQGVIEKAEGSARVWLGNTEVLVGIKVETGEPFPDTPNDGVMTVNAELVPLASPTYEPGPPDETSIELARIVDRGLRESKMLDNSKLCIESGKKVVVVFVDVYVLNYDGNLIDAAALASVTALLNAKMQIFEVENGEVKTKEGSVPLPVKDHPVTVTIGKINDKLVIDPSAEEEFVMDARLSMAINDDGNICAIQKGLSGYFTPQQLIDASKLAREKAAEIRKAVPW